MYFVNMGNLLGKISVVSGLTIVSRLLGLVRDVLFFTCFGVSLIGDAFILAFTLPNLFRRMLGEGTLSSVFIPIYAEQVKNNLMTKANQITNQVLSRLIVFLFILSMVVCLISWGISKIGVIESQKWISGFYLNTIMFPYVLLICASAIVWGL